MQVSTNAKQHSMKWILVVCILRLVGLSMGTKVFVVDNANDTIFYSDAVPGVRLTDLVFKQVPVKGQFNSPGVVTYDSVTTKVVWTEIESRIMRSQRLSVYRSPIRMASRVNPSSLLFNRYRRRLMWFGATAEKITSMNVDRTDKIEHKRLRYQIHALNVDGFNARLYWAETTSIQRSDLGVTELVTVVDGLNNVTTLYFEPQQDTLYWIDQPGLIESFNVTSQERRTLVDISSDMVHPIQIIVFDDVIYWLDSRHGGIGHVDLQNPKDGVRFTTSLIGEKETQFQLSDGLTDLKVFSENILDYCSSSPCPAGAECVPEDDLYACVVPNNTETTGQSPVNMNPCEPTHDLYPCDQEKGICDVINGTATCYCEHGYIIAPNNTCLLDDLEETGCNNDPCVNDGMCVDGRCICPPGFRGSRCEGKLDQHPCLMYLIGYPCDRLNGFCDVNNGTAWCHCRTGYHLAANNNSCLLDEDDDDDDDDEEIRVNCSENPCMNGGVCIDGDCNCLPGYEGGRCEESVDEEECATDPCLNGGTCDDDRCTCLPGYTGSRCEEGPTIDCGSQNEGHVMNKFNRRIIIIVVVITALIFLVVIIVACVLTRRKSKKSDKA